MEGERDWPNDLFLTYIPIVRNTLNPLNLIYITRKYAKQHSLLFRLVR